MKPRLVAIAKRCQMIVGSFDGQTKACDCQMKSECILSLRQIEVGDCSKINTGEC